MKKLIIGAASLMLCAGLQAQDFKINPSGYFENHGANVMVFSDVYPEGHQGGVTLVLNGDRRAAGGDSAAGFGWRRQVRYIRMALAADR